MSDPRCAKCGHPRSNHPYRHPFVGPSLEDDVKALEAKLAKVVAAAGKMLDAFCVHEDSHQSAAYEAMCAALAETEERAMTDIRIFKGDGKRAEDVTGELGDRIKALIYEYSGRMPLAAAVGVLHLVAYEITTDSD